MKTDIQKAIEVFNNGGIVIFPTDTAFGIGCRVDKKETIEKLYEIRERPSTQPMSLLVADIQMAKKYVTDIPQDIFENLIKRYWPGALTIVLEANILTVPASVRANGKTVGIRMPNHFDLLEIIQTIGVPILGPSANFHGKKTPFSLDDLDPNLVKKVDYVLKGNCHEKIASTVIDCTVFPWKVLRQGAISI